MSCEGCEEGAYVIDALAKLLAEIAVIVNGVEPHDTSWSYHDLPEKVRALKQAQQPAAAVPVELAAALARMDECRAGCDAGDPFYADPKAWDIVRAHFAKQPAAAVPEDAFSALLNCASRTAMLAAARKGVGNEH